MIELLAWSRALSLAEAAAWSFVVNLVVLAFTVAIDWLLLLVFPESRISEPPEALTRVELLLAGTSIIGNSLGDAGRMVAFPGR